MADIEQSAPTTPRKPTEKLAPCSPLLWVPSPARARTTPPATPEPKKETVRPEEAALFQVPSPLRVREPPVARVRKMAKGCAVVLIRDHRVTELAVAMAVAVVDGVCVELRRHSRRKHEVEESGIFVAWGHRVERRATVSEEGLEAFFNGLAGVRTPEAVRIQAPFQECLQVFSLSSSNALRLATPQVVKPSKAQLLKGVHGEEDLLLKLWEAKAQLDELWNKPPPPKARSVMQRVARDQLFPHSGKEGKDHENRAGEKLEELVSASGLLEDLPEGCLFLDLCGGPGAWSQFLLAKGLAGFGLTLRSGQGTEEDWQAEQKDDWYPDLMQHPSWQALWGADGTGDLLKPENLQHATQMLCAAKGVFLCVADGGFSDKAIPPNLLELYFYRLLLAELLLATSCLLPGGRFICKLYSSFSSATSALLYLTTRLFQEVRVVKPMASRVAGPERYLVAFGFRPNQETGPIRRALWDCQVLGAGQSPLQLPLLSPLVAPEDMEADDEFLPKLRAMVATLGGRQEAALRAIRCRAEQLEDMALEVAEEAQNHSGHWAEAARRQREAHETEYERRPKAHDNRLPVIRRNRIPKCTTWN
ncbi:unnamed protein product [Effrenium voratum]|uniref:Cap-specific mRNA (nucleoside-2'-O-)-methyltransferase 1 n=1 Tax=Effrenium voratum TaxID=2562239 RepID=A0AA36HY60_9DINO|nr:unnamed protein product [Effrenium voratum]CAJ1421606.1 unnamed protein product [Effrenium voratum]